MTERRQQRESMEVVAKTVEEAIDIALEELGAARDEVEIEVVSRGRPGFLGLGADPARVRVALAGALAQARREPAGEEEEEEEELQPPGQDWETATLARTITADLLRHMGVTAEAYLREPGAAGGPVVQVEGEDAGLIIGRRGETLQALEFLVNYLVSRQSQGRARIQVDAERYKERRYQSLQGLARRMAEKATSSGRPVTLNPMPPAERRVVHLALADNPRVRTQSVGEEGNRRISIRPRERGELSRDQDRGG